MKSSRLFPSLHDDITMPVQCLVPVWSIFLIVLQCLSVKVVYIVIASLWHRPNSLFCFWPLLLDRYLQRNALIEVFVILRQSVTFLYFNMATIVVSSWLNTCVLLTFLHLFKRLNEHHWSLILALLGQRARI